MTRAPGYLLEVPAEATDVFGFEQLVARGVASSRAGARASACGCWPRPRTSGAVRPTARCATSRLPGPRRGASKSCSSRPGETRIDAELTLGRHEAVTGELETLTSAHPMRERLWSQRMLALYRAGRQAEALRVFQDLRAVLVAELGIEPGHDVTWMEHAILAQEPGARLRRPARATTDRRCCSPRRRRRRATRSGSRRSPHEGPLRRPCPRVGVLARVVASVPSGAGRLLLVDGDPGIGKTRLVADLARAVRDEGALVLWGRCDEEPVAPFQPFAEALGRYFQSDSADRISTMPDWQLTELSRLVLRLREYAPRLDEEGGEPESTRFRFFEAVTATLSELSRRRPVLLVVDDLHWADQPTLLLLRHVLRDIDDGQRRRRRDVHRHRGPAGHRLRASWPTSGRTTRSRPCTSRG